MKPGIFVLSLKISLSSMAKINWGLSVTDPFSHNSGFQFNEGLKSPYVLLPSGLCNSFLLLAWLW